MSWLHHRARRPRHLPRLTWWAAGTKQPGYPECWAGPCLQIAEPSSGPSVSTRPRLQGHEVTPTAEPDRNPATPASTRRSQSRPSHTDRHAAGHYFGSAAETASRYLLFARRRNSVPRVAAMKSTGSPSSTAHLARGQTVRKMIVARARSHRRHAQRHWRRGTKRRGPHSTSLRPSGPPHRANAIRNRTRGPVLQGPREVYDGGVWSPTEPSSAENTSRRCRASWSGSVQHPGPQSPGGLAMIYQR